MPSRPPSPPPGSPRLEVRLLGEAPAVSRQIASFARARLIQKIFRGNPAAWTPVPRVARLIQNRLGWLNAPQRMLRETARLKAFAARAREDRIRRVVVLGMGGSSLCVEVFRRVLPRAAGSPEVIVLDSTVPEAVRRVEASIDPAATLFVVSSKSGGTVETAVLQSYFWDRMARLRGRDARRHFVAITDPGTPLAEEAESRGWRAVFINPPDVGGRYSALTYFGLVPAALGGADIGALLRRALAWRDLCIPAVRAPDNPALVLGTALGAMARRGRDKVVLCVDPALRPLAAWIEQLLAESTGKDDRGLVPIDPPDPPAARTATLRGPDRVAVVTAIGRGGNGARTPAWRALPDDTPSLALTLEDRLDLGGGMFVWELATAVAGAALVVDPFDEPNVAESKANTEAALRQADATGALGEETPALHDGRTRVFVGGLRTAPGRPSDLAEAVSILLSARRRNDYLALLAYVDPGSRRLRAPLEAIRGLLAATVKVPVMPGFGPRYLHSTGQLHKGGPDEGLFLQVVPADPHPAPIPGRSYDFETLKQAQALGDYLSLKRRGRRVLRLQSDDTALKALRALLAATRTALGAPAGRGRASRSRRPAGRRGAVRTRRARRHGAGLNTAR